MEDVLEPILVCAPLPAAGWATSAEKHIAEEEDDGANIGQELGPLGRHLQILSPPHQQRCALPGHFRCRAGTSLVQHIAFLSHQHALLHLRQCPQQDLIDNKAITSKRDCRLEEFIPWQDSMAFVQLLPAWSRQLEPRETHSPP